MAATASALELAPRQDEEVLAVETQARTIADEAHDLQIVDEQANATALEMLSTVRSTVKRIEALKKRWLEPLNKQVKLIRADFDAIAAPAKEADAILSRKTSAYRAKVAEAARKEQARLNALAAKRQERAAARAEERGEDPPPIIPLVPKVETPAKTVATGSGAKVTYRKQTHFEIVDAAVVPREWCIPDTKKLGAAARAGIIGPDNAPSGVRVWVTEEPTVR
jgi:hypothetical protein